MIYGVQNIRERLERYMLKSPRGPGAKAISIKLRVRSGCFHREHSPHAYALIDECLAAHPPSSREFQFEEHESGPEVIVLVNASLSLAASVIALVVAIINARAAGIKKGDRHSQVDLIVRRTDDRTGIKEETVLRICDDADLQHSEIERELLGAVRRLLADKLATPSSTKARPSQKGHKEASKKAPKKKRPKQ